MDRYRHTSRRCSCTLFGFGVLPGHTRRQGLYLLLEKVVERLPEGFTERSYGLLNNPLTPPQSFTIIALIVNDEDTESMLPEAPNDACAPRAPPSSSPGPPAHWPKPLSLRTLALPTRAPFAASMNG